MALQSLVRVNRDYIAKYSKKSKNWHIFFKNEKFKNLKKSFFTIPEIHTCAKFYDSSNNSVVRIDRDGQTDGRTDGRTDIPSNIGNT